MGKCSFLGLWKIDRILGNWMTGNKEKHGFGRTFCDSENEFIMMLILVFHLFDFIAYIRA